MMSHLWRRVFHQQLPLKSLKQLLGPSASKSLGCSNLYGKVSSTALLNRDLHTINKLGSGSGLEIEWDDGKKSLYHSSWLRFNCSCDKCKQSHSGQRTIRTGEIPDQIVLSSVSLSGPEESQELLIRWQNEDHNSSLPLKWLREHSYSDEDIEKQSQQRAPTAYQGRDPPTVDYDEVMTTDDGVLQYLTQLSEHGISLMKGVPCREDVVMQVAERAGPVLNTIYGKHFQVFSQPSPINIAYSDAELCLHMDLAYYQSPPGLQLLHCLRFDQQVVGGDSIFLDVFAVAKEFRKNSPEDFDTLVRVPATFQKVHFERENPVYLKYQRPHIVLNHRKEIVAVTWSPPFEGPLFVNKDDVEVYYKAYRKFDKAIKESPKLEFKLNEGELVTFNNIRVLHGRKSFQLNGGMRQLQGCYVNIDEFRKTFDVTSRLVGDGRLSRRVGNNCFF